MPEGDTVFLTGRRLDAALGGRVLQRGELRHPALSVVDLAGRTVVEADSVGKHLFVRFDDGRSLHSHLRMDGSWRVHGPGERWRRPAHEARAVLANQDQEAVGFLLHDLALLPTREEASLVGHLGPDLLGRTWGETDRREAERRLAADPERAVGEALLDQRVMAGLGNLYQCEICFLLRVSPWTRVADVDPAAAVDLARRLLAANAWRWDQRTTGSSRRGQRHWVYRRAGLACARCGATIRRGTLGPGPSARIVYHCPRCQPAPHR
ncbi:DNA-formamidopyrimidine glycosylase family protein [Actinoalloteichus spitiensis]|uniref:DNA-formamidopyrimidine glycosylase family protein n=1 Tax=Actinoalloteichus spitiensis TaxID=252394 RepID=UPI000364C4BA|nr:DNA-formamidopyrimidine glycosylase family protein [Actinoalloteichus spitiensis]